MLNRVNQVNTRSRAQGASGRNSMFLGLTYRRMISPHGAASQFRMGEWV